MGVFCRAMQTIPEQYQTLPDYVQSKSIVDPDQPEYAFFWWPMHKQFDNNPAGGIVKL